MSRLDLGCESSRLIEGATPAIGMDETVMSLGRQPTRVLPLKAQVTKCYKILSSFSSATVLLHGRDNLRTLLGPLRQEGKAPEVLLSSLRSEGRKEAQP